jgi:hypothetical protein
VRGDSWPVWEGHGPLSHVVSIDCASVIRLLPSLDLPDSGRLAFFYFDGHHDDYKSTVGVWDPATQDCGPFTGDVRICRR